MGRKSSAKKKRRIEQDETIKKTSKKKTKNPAKGAAKNSAKDSTKDSTKETPSVLSKIKVPKVKPQKIFGSLLAFILFGLLVVVSTTLFQKAFGPVSLANYLPEEETAAFLELNTNFDHIQLVKAAKLLEGTAYSTEETTKKIEERLGVNIKEDILPWVGRQAGIAEILLGTEDKHLESIYFLETINKKDSEKFLQTIAENNLSELETAELNENQKKYSFDLRYPGEDRKKDMKITAIFLEEYLVLSPSEEAIETLLEKESTKIGTNSKYIEARDNAPTNKVLFVFMNFKNSPDMILQKYGVYTDSPLINSAIQPFAELFNSEGAALMAKDEYFVVEAFLNLNEEYLKGNKYITYKDKYSADLTSYIPDNINAFWGGEDIEKQIKRLVALLSEGNQSTSQVFEGVLKNYTEKYFGSSVSLEEDIYPLVQNEFALAILDDNIYTLILELDSPTDNALKIQKIANNFISSGAVFEPHIEEYELPDGTISKEIVATPEEIIKSESKYGEIIIYEIQTKSKNWGVYYSIVDGKMIASTSKDILTESLKLLTGESINSLKESKINNVHITPALSDSDEVSYFDIAQFWPESKLIKSISTGKEYMSNGVKAHYYIYVE